VRDPRPEVREGEAPRDEEAEGGEALGVSAGEGEGVLVKTLDYPHQHEGHGGEGLRVWVRGYDLGREPRDLGLFKGASSTPSLSALAC
jgi:hypothetical protein